MATRKQKSAPDEPTSEAGGKTTREQPHTKLKNQKQETLAAALSYAKSRGWHLFPAPPGEKKSYKSAEYSGGRPWGMTCDRDEIRQDFMRWPDAGIGIPTGPVNNIWVLDVDTVKGHGVDGVAALQQLEAIHGALPPTLQVISPSGSQHYYWQWPDDGTVIRN